MRQVCTGTVQPNWPALKWTVCILCRKGLTYPMFRSNKICDIRWEQQKVLKSWEYLKKYQLMKVANVAVKYWMTIEWSVIKWSTGWLSNDLWFARCQVLEDNMSLKCRTHRFIWIAPSIPSQLTLCFTGDIVSDLYRTYRSNLHPGTRVLCIPCMID